MVRCYGVFACVWVCRVCYMCLPDVCKRTQWCFMAWLLCYCLCFRVLMNAFVVFVCDLSVLLHVSDCASLCDVVCIVLCVILSD